MADWPLPPRIREFQALENHVFKKMYRGAYSHQSLYTAAIRMIETENLSAHSMINSSLIRLLLA